MEIGIANKVRFSLALNGFWCCRKNAGGNGVQGGIKAKLWKSNSSLCEKSKERNGFLWNLTVVEIIASLNLYFKILFTLVLKFNVKKTTTHYIFENFSKARNAIEHWSERTVITSQGGSFVYIIYLLFPIDHVVGLQVQIGLKWVCQRAGARLFLLICYSELNTRQGCYVVDYCLGRDLKDGQRFFLKTIFLFPKLSLKIKDQ